MIASSVIRVGDRVYWRDPDDDLCSGWGKVVSLDNEEDSEEWDNETIAYIEKDDGGEVECPLNELYWKKPNK